MMEQEQVENERPGKERALATWAIFALLSVLFMLAAVLVDTGFYEQVNTIAGAP